MRLYRFIFKSGDAIEVPLESINISKTSDGGMTGSWVEVHDGPRIEVVKWSEVIMITSRPVVATHPYRPHAPPDATEPRDPR